MIGDYVPLAFKDLSKNEVKYLDLLNTGIDELIQVSVKSLKSKELQELLRLNDFEIFKEEFKKTNLYSDLNNIISENSSKGIVPIRYFYKIGSRLGHQSLNRSRELNKYDEEAISILYAYVGDLITNLNQSAGIGIRNTLYNYDYKEDSKRQLEMELLDVPLQIVDRFTINTHARMIATTEYSRALNTGTLQAFSNDGVQDVNIITTGLPNVCDVCIETESRNPYTLEEAMKILPQHPHCACSVVSANSINTGFNGIPIIIDLTQ